MFDEGSPGAGYSSIGKMEDLALNADLSSTKATGRSSSVPYIKTRVWPPNLEVCPVQVQREKMHYAMRGGIMRTNQSAILGEAQHDWTADCSRAEWVSWRYFPVRFQPSNETFPHHPPHKTKRSTITRQDKGRRHCFLKLNSVLWLSPFIRQHACRSISPLNSSVAADISEATYSPKE
jgi:hypothetical protein